LFINAEAQSFQCTDFSTQPCRKGAETLTAACRLYINAAAAQNPPNDPIRCQIACGGKIEVETRGLIQQIKVLATEKERREAGGE